MRLIFKLSLFYLVISLVVFIIGYTITYEVIKREIDFEQERFLAERLESALRMIERRQLDEVFIREKIRIEPLKEEVEETELIFSDTVVMHQSLQRMEPHIKLDVIKNINGRSYKILIYDLIIEEDDIEEGVQESLIKMYVILIVLVILLSAVSSYYLLKPFNKTLDKIKLFNIKAEPSIKFGSSNTREFDKLNLFLNEMTLKMKNDYLALKEFTENASHEMQTPIAIATGKLELLRQSGDLSDEQTMLLNSAEDSIRRLSKIGNALSLLAKIENREFEAIESVNISNLIKKLLYDFNELLLLKEIQVKAEIKDDVILRIDPTLAAILLTNLIQNAIRHNIYQGEILINLNSEKLNIKNLGNPLTFPARQMFERFKKNDQSKESVGLGLAIVKKIIDVNKYSISYNFEDNYHSITVEF